MLSKKEYDDIINKLNETPSTISTNTRKNLRKQLKEHEYSSKFAPFEPLPHIPDFINRTTTEQTLNQLIQAATMSLEFVIDTESFNILHQTNKPALIQLQIFLPHDSSFVLLIEVCHLPKHDHNCFKLIQQLFRMIFTPEKKIFIFGSKQELYPFTKFELFSYDQINNVNIINLQKEFKIFWNKKYPHRSTYPTSLTTSTNCRCEQCIGKQSYEPWSLQDCVVYLLNEYLPKTLTNENFQIGLDPELFKVNPNEQHHRYLLSTYAKNDCLSMQRLIIQMKNNHFDFNSSSIIRISNDILDLAREDKSSTYPSVQIRKINPRFILPKLDDDLEFISSDDDYPSEQQISNQILSVKKSLTPSIDTPKTKNEVLLTENPMMIHTPVRTLPLITDEHRYPRDWESFTTNGHRPGPRREKEQLSSNYTRLSAEERKRIHNRSCTIKQRRRYYRCEIICRDIDNRFSVTKVKRILRQHNISFSAINICKSSTSRTTCLYIGIKEETQLHTYEQITQNLFTTDHYRTLYGNHKPKSSVNRSSRSFNRPSTSSYNRRPTSSSNHRSTSTINRQSHRPSTSNHQQH